MISSIFKILFNLLVINYLLIFAGCSSSLSKEINPGARTETSSSIAKGNKDFQKSIPPQGGQQIQRLLVYNSNLYFDIPSDSLDEIKSKIINYAKSKDGYIVTESTYQITIKIPSDIFREALNEIKKWGKVRSETINTEDITDVYYDSKIRLENSTKLQKRFTDLLSKAKNVQDAIEVEKELNRITNEIEVLKGKINRYDNQINFSVIAIHLQRTNERKLGPLGWVVYGGYRAVRWLFFWD